MMNKYILIIGASSGYGLSTAKVLQEAGFFIIGASRSFPKNHEKIFHKYFLCNVEKNEDFTLLSNGVKELLAGEKLSGVVYSAGIAKGLNTIVDGNPDWWIEVFNTNTIGLLRTIKQFVPFLGTGGCFIHIGSISSELNYIGGADYCASKAATTSIMKNLRLELGGENIRSVTLEPGYGDTNFMLRRFDGDAERAKKKIDPMDPKYVGDFVRYILESDPSINFDRVFIKPLAQVTH